MPVQTAYTAEHDALYEGQRVNFETVNIFSRAAEGSDIPFGRAVVRGTADDQAQLPSSAVDDFVGITEYTTAWSETASDLHLYTENREMNIMDFGKIGVYTETAVVPGDPVFFRHTATTAPLDVVGRFRNDSGSNLATQIIGATFESTTAAGEIAIVRIRDTKTINVTTITAVTAAIPLTADVVLFDTTLGASTSTLADGYEGQVIQLLMTVDGGDQVLTPANLLGGTTITYGDVGDATTLRFSSGSWAVIANNGAVVA